MKTIWKSMIAAFAMYSKIPMPPVDYSEEDMKYSMCFFPLIGVVIGLLLCGWRIGYPYLCDGEFLPAVVFVIVPVIVSGAVHVDGFIDTVDAICAHKPMERKLEILKDKHTGSFAIIMTISYFLIALGVWSEMPINAVPILSVGFVLSRALSGLAIVMFPHARTSKLLVPFSNDKQKKIVGAIMALYILVCVVFMCSYHPLHGTVGVIAALVSFAYYYYISKKHFGGITGDVASYFVQVCELIIPCAVLVAWKFLGV